MTRGDRLQADQRFQKTTTPRTTATEKAPHAPEPVGEQGRSDLGDVEAATLGGGGGAHPNR
jgi:hypothetical protein